jgi:hypothetical protein
MGKNGRKKKGNRYNEDGEGRAYRSKGKKKSIKRSNRNWNKRFTDDIRDGIIKEDELDFL